MFDHPSLSITLWKAIALCWRVMRAIKAEKQKLEVEVVIMAKNKHVGNQGDNQEGNQQGDDQVDAQEERLLKKKMREAMRNMRIMQRRRWKT